jgi:transcriptional regulator with XRE-family HTH domain
LAKRAGVARDTLSNAEKGRHSLQGPSLSKIARALGKAPSELMAEEERLAPKAQASLPLEYGRSEDVDERRVGPRYTAFEAFGRALALSWVDNLEEWDRRMPDGEWPNAVDFARLVQWTLEVAATQAIYQAIARELSKAPRAELTDALEALDQVSRASRDMVSRAYEPVKTHSEFRRIWDANDMDTVISEAGRA